MTIQLFAKKIVAVGLFITLCVANTSCSNPEPSTPEERVKATLLALELAAEQRTLSGLLQHISDDYADHQGRTKDDIGRLVQLQYIRNQEIYIISKLQSLDIDGDTAIVELSAAMAATGSDTLGQTKRLNARTHHFSLVLRSNDDLRTWLVTAVSWKNGWE